MVRGRPQISSRAAVEEVALRCFERDGYARTTIESLSAASGISKTTFFRYFRSKSDIVWGVFDTHIDRLRSNLERFPDDARMMDAVRATVTSALLADADEQGLWLRRFRLFDTSPDMRDEALSHWHAWAIVISEYAAGRMHQQPAAFAPATIGAAVQAAVVATLRSWAHETAPPSALIARLDSDLAPLCDVLQEWADGHDDRS